MADVKWIKICIDIFDDEKISLIDAMPESDGIIVIWFKLLCLAGKQNNGGVFMLNDKIAYTDEMLSTIFRRPLNTVRMALQVFEQFGMIEIINNTITIPNWEKHQNFDKLEKAKEKNRQRVAAHRQRQKALAECNDYSNVTVTECNAADKEEDKEEDKDNINILPDFEQEFENLWKLYPRKQGKPKALKAYIKARKKGVTFEQVENGIKAYCEQIKKQKTKAEYIKHGSTWFNGECWNDEYNTSVSGTAASKYQLNGGINL